MMSSFNFYDIYGYILPGTLLYGLFWLPFALATGTLPTTEISTSLLLLVVAYILGVVLQSVAQLVVPSKVADAQGHMRVRSNALLDADNTRFTDAFKKELATKVNEAFGLEVLGATDAELRNRDVAFFEARSYLSRNKSSPYMEQFEGLYALSRGMGCALVVGCAYLVGWGLSFHWKFQNLGLFAWEALAVSIVGALGLTVLPAGARILKGSGARPGVGLACFLLLGTASAGYFVGTWKTAPAPTEFFLWLAAAATPIGAAIFLRAYQGFAENFAETVWRDFAAAYTQPTPPPVAPGEGQAGAKDGKGGGEKEHGGEHKHEPEPGGGHKVEPPAGPGPDAAGKQKPGGPPGFVPAPLPAHRPDAPVAHKPAPGHGGHLGGGNKGEDHASSHQGGEGHGGAVHTGEGHPVEVHHGDGRGRKEGGR
jgi:hypothetical protein